MKINVNNIAQALVQQGIPAEAQGRYIKLAVARVVGYLLPVPAESVEGSLQVYFKGTQEGKVVPVLDALIERFPFDFEETMELIRVVWELRYNLVHARTDLAVWGLLDTAVASVKLESDVEFKDPVVQLLSAALRENLE